MPDKKSPDHEIQMYQSDHDLLIRIDTKLGTLIEQFHKHKDATLKELSVLNEQKLNRVEALAMKAGADEIHKDYETRLRRIERYGSVAVGAVLVIQAILGVKII